MDAKETTYRYGKFKQNNKFPIADATAVNKSPMQNFMDTTSTSNAVWYMAHDSYYKTTSLTPHWAMPPH